MTREEAIKEIKFWDFLNEKETEAIETLIPELRKSEDERIRKEIIEYFKHYSGGDNISVRFPKWIAYLEKQKAKERLDRMAPIYNDKESFESALEKAWKYYNESASRTVDSFEDNYIECVFSKGFREGFLYREKQKEQEHNEGDFTIYHPLKNGKGEYECIPYSFYGSLTSFSEDKDLIDFLRTCFYTEEECNEWIEQQKEQKQQLPLMGGDTDTYFDDLRMTTKPITSREWFNEGIKYAQMLQKEQKPEWSEKHIAYIFEKVGLAKIAREQGNDKLTNALQDAMLKLSKVENTEWSDTDNIGWDDAFACVTEVEKAAKNEEELQNAVAAEKWLKEIKFKYYVNPVKQEWSEEDVYITNVLEYIVGKHRPDEIFKIGNKQGVSAYKICSWLKSLRPQPHWKPSKEQMEALDDAILFDKTVFRRKKLVSLLKDLKKLM